MNVKLLLYLNLYLIIIKIKNIRLGISINIFYFFIKFVCMQVWLYTVYMKFYKLINIFKKCLKLKYFYWKLFRYI